MTIAPMKGLTWRCQGLHNDVFLPYGSSHIERLAAAYRRSPQWAFNLSPPCREDECIGC
jgi:hypothetical protein